MGLTPTNRATPLRSGLVPSRGCGGGGVGVANCVDFGLLGPMRDIVVNVDWAPIGLCEDVLRANGANYGLLPGTSCPPSSFIFAATYDNVDAFAGVIPASAQTAICIHPSGFNYRWDAGATVRCSGTFLYMRFLAMQFQSGSTNVTADHFSVTASVNIPLSTFALGATYAFTDSSGPQNNTAACRQSSPTVTGTIGLF